MFARSILLLGCVCLWLSSGNAQAGDVVLGRSVSKKLCVNCHIVEPGGQADIVNPAIPTFMAIAEKPEQTASRIRGFLLDPHPPMPNIQLTAHELDDIATYILSLKE